VTMRNLRIPIGWLMVTVGLFLFGCASVKDVEILDKEADRLSKDNRQLMHKIIASTCANVKSAQRPTG